ncbi:MAG: cysteine--tRNA ligase [Paracoccaceae bacterium]
MSEHPIRLRNTASKSREPEPFVPLDWQDDSIPSKEKKVRMYVCGPTVYDRAHLGNARPVVVFDVLFRLLRHVYGPDHVTYVRNFTDVDDKIIRRAEETGRPIDQITAETTQWFLDDMGALGALQPTQMPRATDYIKQMVAMIETLIEGGHAYAEQGHVLFEVDSWKEHYGELSGRTVEDMIAGARVEVAPYKRNPMDFVLWKPSTDDQPGWDGPVWEGKSVGRGRPGWHIECSAMARALLGETFDIHGGGNDLMFPHHENEIAQSCCANHTDRMANVWLHNEMLQVEGRKMSKSLGNFFTVRDLLDGNWSGGWKVPGEVIRFVFLSTHYRKPMDWTEEKARESFEELEKWALGIGNAKPDSADVPQGLIEALADDLNTHGAITELRRCWKSDDMAGLRAGMEFLGLLLEVDAGDQAAFDWMVAGETARDRIKELIDELKSARAQKDFARADTLRDALKSAGITLSYDKDGGVTYKREADFDPAKLEALK